MVQLRTERLLLREFTEDDWEALHAFESLPDVARYQDFAPRSEAESRAYVAGAIASTGEEPRCVYDLAVDVLGEDRLIGRCGLGLGDPDPAQGALWYTLHPAYWGRGYTTEAAWAVIDFGFRELGLHRIWADCDPRNVASWRVLERLGLRREAHLRENAHLKEEWVDSFVYAVLAWEWM